MKRVGHYIDQMHDELCGAEEYANKYIECKIDQHMDKAATYKDMAEDELIHATFFHKIAGEELEKVNRVLAPSIEMQEKWTAAQQEFNEKTAWVKSLLSM